MSLFMSSIEALGFKLRPPESNVTPLPTKAEPGRVTPPAIIENDEPRGLIRARGDAQQPAESLVADPRLVPDVDGKPGVGSDQGDSLGKMPRRLFRGWRVHKIACQIHGMADNLAATKALLEFEVLFLGLVDADDQAQSFECMPNRFGLPHSRPARTGDGPLDQGRGKHRRIIGGWQNNRHAVTTLAGQPLGQGKTRRKRRARLESPPRTQTDQEDRACLEPRKLIESRELAQRARQVFLADQTINDRFEGRPTCHRRGFGIILEDSQNQPLRLNRLNRLP